MVGGLILLILSPEKQCLSAALFSSSVIEEIVKKFLTSYIFCLHLAFV